MVTPVVVINPDVKNDENVPVVLTSYLYPLNPIPVSVAVDHTRLVELLPLTYPPLVGVRFVDVEGPILSL